MNNTIRVFRRGFTLIELLVVIAIIGLLASIVLVSLSSARAKSREAKRQSDMIEIQKGLELFYAANGRYPSGADGACGYTTSFLGGGCMNALVIGKFIPVLPSNPSGGSYYYDNWCNVPAVNDNQNYRMWADMEYPQPAQQNLWWGGNTFGATTCTDPS